jgi:hypothetical protein
MPLRLPLAVRSSAVTLGIAAVLFVLLLATTALAPYGYFIDELYYLACARRLALGYVDHPPLSIGILAAVKALLGDSTTAIRLPAMLAVAAVPVVSSRLARRFGGGPFAQGLAALASAVAPVSLVLGSFYSMNAFEWLLWPAVALVLVEVLDGGDPRGWLVVGVLLGLGLENKHTTVLLGGAVAVGLLLTPSRAVLRTRWPWAGAVVALVLLAPNLLWQRAHGFPSLEFYRNAQAAKNIATPPLQVLAGQLLFLGLGSAPVWIAGAAWLLRARASLPYRFLGWAFVVLLALLLASRSSRPDRIAAFYPILFAAGGVAVEAAARDTRRWLRVAAPALVVVSAAVTAPLTLPVLPPERVAAYARVIGLLPRLERGKASSIPQWLADRTGWESFVADVDAVYRSLPPEDQAQAAILCPSYGQAGAVELFGPRRGLPRVISPHNSYWTWADEPSLPAVLIAVGARDLDLDAAYTTHRLAAVSRCDYCMSWRDEMPIFVARGPRLPFRAVWDRARRFE